MLLYEARFKFSHEYDSVEFIENFERVLEIYFCLIFPLQKNKKIKQDERA